MSCTLVGSKHLMFYTRAPPINLQETVLAGWVHIGKEKHLNLEHTHTHTHTHTHACQDQGVRYICAGIAEQQEGLCVLNLSSNGINPDGIHHVSAMLVRKYLLCVMCNVHMYMIKYLLYVVCAVIFPILHYANIPPGACFYGVKVSHSEAQLWIIITSFAYICTCIRHFIFLCTRHIIHKIIIF